MEKKCYRICCYPNLPILINDVVVLSKYKKDSNEYVCLIECYRKNYGQSLDHIIKDSIFIDHKYYKYSIEIINEYKSILRNDKIKILLNE